MALSDDIARALSSNDVMLSAEPGAGKSTGLPLALMHHSDVSGNILLLEPRRIAARSVAGRLATHLNEKIGQQVGLRMRLDTRISEQTRITVVTEGVLTRMLQDDPSLDGISLVIFDEFHERSLQADLGLALCLEVKQALRADLKLLLMSATLDIEQINSRIDNLKHFHCPTRQHSVDIIWEGEASTPLTQQALHATLKAIDNEVGDILVFLPGVAEINKLARALQPRLTTSIQLHLLHGNIGISDQEKATAKAQPGTRRIILSTSLAETSVTIDGVKIVIDSGLERRAKTDRSTGAQRLETVLSSQASATQRTGRAGRTDSGVCYRLWSETGHTRRPTQWQPEIYRADLTPMLIELGVWGATNIHEMPWIDLPPEASTSRAEDLLSRLGLWYENKLTERGRLVAKLPVHPRLGHMMIWAAEHNRLNLGATITALLDEQSRSSRELDIDYLLNEVPSKFIKQRANQLSKLLNNQCEHSRQPSAAVLLAQAFPDWIAQRRPGDVGRFQLACGAGVVIDSDNELAHCPWLVVAQLGGSGTQLRIFKAIQLSIDELEEYSPELFKNSIVVDWDDSKQRVVAEQRKMLENLIVHTRPHQDISNTDKERALIMGIRRAGLECLPWTQECFEWQARVQRMQSISITNTTPEWPSVDAASLTNTLEDWLLPWLQGIGTLKALQQLNLYDVLNALLDYQQQSLLDKYLPTRYTVPSGSKIRLSYIPDGDPVLSVRLQEMLGCRKNPTVASGQLPLKVELLSPAHRPVQVTRDLVNFWSSSYPEVKKEMAGRYPKHYWPDDPINAEPTTKAKKRN